MKPYQRSFRPAPPAWKRLKMSSVELRRMSGQPKRRASRKKNALNASGRTMRSSLRRVLCSPSGCGRRSPDFGFCRPEQHSKEEPGHQPEVGSPRSRGLPTRTSARGSCSTPTLVSGGWTATSFVNLLNASSVATCESVQMNFRKVAAPRLGRRALVPAASAREQSPRSASIPVTSRSA